MDYIWNEFPLLFFYRKEVRENLAISPIERGRIFRRKALENVQKKKKKLLIKIHADVRLLFLFGVVQLLGNL